jgi:hypothetical protein
MSNTISEQTVTRDIVDLSRRTGLVIGSADSAAVNRLFNELEKYDEGERPETFLYLKRALNETRTSLGSEPAFKDE